MDILGGLGSLASGILGYMGAKEQNQTQKDIAAQNIALQKEFAQTGIRWKVEDAKAAGIHPLYALGANTTSFAPVSVGTTNAMSPLADMAKNLGQDLSRSVDATRTGKERVAARVEGVASGLQLDNMKLKNDLLRAQIAKLNQSQVGPGMPVKSDNYMIPGQADSPMVNSKPLDVAPGNPVQPSSEGGAIADVGYARTTTGWAPVPSNDVKQRIEDNFMPEFMWNMRNQILPNFGVNRAPPPVKPPPGKFWQWNPWRQEYQLWDYKYRHAPKFGLPYHP